MNTTELKEFIKRKEEEAKALPDAKKRLLELERESKELERVEQQRMKVAREKAIHSKVHPIYSPVYVKLRGNFIEADKFLFNRGEIVGCGTDLKTGTHVFFKIGEGRDEVFVDKYRPR